MPIRDFDAARRERIRIRQADPIQFVLGGETFTISMGPTLADVFDLADAPEVTTDDLAAMRAMDKFIRSIILPEQVKTWQKVLAAKGEQYVDNVAMLELVQYLSEEMYGRPLDTSSALSNGVQPITQKRKSSRSPKRKAS